MLVKQLFEVFKSGISRKDAIKSPRVNRGVQNNFQAVKPREKIFIRSHNTIIIETKLQFVTLPNRLAKTVIDHNAAYYSTYPQNTLSNKMILRAEIIESLFKVKVKF